MSEILGGELQIDPDAPVTTLQIAPGRWQPYRVNENTVDWRFVVDPQLDDK